MQLNIKHINDRELAERINEELVRNPHISAGNVWVDVNDGTVTLAGTVANDCVKQLTERVIKGIAGVDEVDSLLHSERPQLFSSYGPCGKLEKTIDRNELKFQYEVMLNEGGPGTYGRMPIHA